MKDIGDELIRQQVQIQINVDNLESNNFDFDKLNDVQAALISRYIDSLYALNADLEQILNLNKVKK